MSLSRNQQTALWSITGLTVTIFVAWYFSTRKQTARNDTDISNPETPTLAPSQYTFNVPPLDVPPITPSTNGTAAPNACCTRCAGQNQSAGTILQSGMFTQDVFTATRAALTNVHPATTTTPSATLHPTGPALILQDNGGMPLPSPLWWTADPIYRQAYLQAYNQVAGSLANILIAQHRSAIPTLSNNYANGSYASISDAVTAAGDAQQARAGHDSRWLAEGRTNSLQMFSQMQTVLNTWLQNFGDPNMTAMNGGSTIGAPDQTVITIQ